jgi:hypothetical protein
MKTDSSLGLNSIIFSKRLSFNILNSLITSKVYLIKCYVVINPEQFLPVLRHSIFILSIKSDFYWSTIANFLNFLKILMRLIQKHRNLNYLIHFYFQSFIFILLFIDRPPLLILKHKNQNIQIFIFKYL